MKQVRAVLVKPLDGEPAGAERILGEVDFDRLKAMGAVKKAANQAGIVDPDSDEAKAERAREAGWVAVATHDAVVAELTAAKARIAELEKKPAGRGAQQDA